MNDQQERVRIIAKDGKFLEDWVQEKNEKRKIEKKNRWKKRGIYGLIAVGVIGIGTLYRRCIQEEAREYLPKGGYPTVDLDKNGVTDWIILRRDGYKIPLYAVGDENKVSYYSGDEMKIRFRSTLDYQSIEDRLNKEF